MIATAKLRKNIESRKKGRYFFTFFGKKLFYNQFLRVPTAAIEGFYKVNSACEHIGSDWIIKRCFRHVSKALNRLSGEVGKEECFASEGEVHKAVFRAWVGAHIEHVCQRQGRE